jgi:hypothetical protein
MSNKNNLKKQDSLIITNKKILDFYNKNPQLDFEIMSCVFIDFLEKIMNDINGTINNTITNDILLNVKDISKELSSIKIVQSELSNIKDTINKLNNEISSNILLKINQIKKDYVDDLKMILSSTENNNIIKIIDIIEKQNESLLAKTQNFINDIIPKNQTIYYNQIESIIKSYKDDTNNHFLELKNYKNDLTLDKITNIFEQKQNQFIISIQQPLLNYITSSEERLSKNIQSLSDVNINNITNQEKINDIFSDYIKKNSSLVSKNIGENGEEKLLFILNKIYTNADIIDCTGLAKHGDIIMKRNLLPTILFENKHYSKNVPKDEVLKFIRDCDEQNTSGIMLSHIAGIANKNNFQIDIQNKNVLIYIHYCDYDEFKIQSCVSLIDNLTAILHQIKKNNNDNIISEQILFDINQEFQTFINQKETLINFIKDTNKKIINQITDFEFPSLNKLLSTKFASTKTLDLKCNICNKFTGTNSKSLSAHKNKCKNNNNNDNDKTIEL